MIYYLLCIQKEKGDYIIVIFELKEGTESNENDIKIIEETKNSKLYMMMIVPN